MQGCETGISLLLKAYNGSLERAINLIYTARVAATNTTP